MAWIGWVIAAFLAGLLLAWLGWVITAFFAGFHLAGFFDSHRHKLTLRDRLSVISSFRGKTVEEVRQIAHCAPCIVERMQSGQIKYTWQERAYTITLLFDRNGICLGVNEEHG